MLATNREIENKKNIKEIIFCYNEFELSNFYFSIFVDFSKSKTIEYINFIYNKLKTLPVDDIILLYYSLYSNNYSIIENVEKLNYFTNLLDIKIYEDDKLYDLEKYNNFENLLTSKLVKTQRKTFNESFFYNYEFEVFDKNNSINFNRIVNDRIIIEVQTKLTLDENMIIDNDFDKIAFMIANPIIFSTLYRVCIGDISLIADVLNISIYQLQTIIDSNKNIRGSRFIALNILKTIFPRQMLENTYSKDKYILEYIHKFFEEITDEQYDDEKIQNENGGVLSVVFFNGAWDGEEVLDVETNEKYQQLKDKLKEDFDKKN